MKVVRIRPVDPKDIERGAFIAVAGDPGRKFTEYVAVMGFPVRKRKMRNNEFVRYTKAVPNPLRVTCSKMLGVGRRHGITKGARQLLNKGRAA